MDIKKILKDENFIFKKAFGQNFLTDDELLSSIVDLSGIDENTTVLEIGVGGGTLTRAISKKAKRVVGFEIDKNLLFISLKGDNKKRLKIVLTLKSFLKTL